MKKIFSTLVLAMSFYFVQAQELPSTSIRDLNGKEVPFNETHTPGKITLYSFWATWCVPCKLEINNIKAKLDNWKKQVDFEYVTVSIDDARYLTQIKTYTKSKGWNFPVYHDANSDLKRSLNFQDIPFTMIVDQEGRIVFQHTDYKEGSEDELLERMKHIAK